LKNGKVYFELNEQVGDAMNAFSAPEQTDTAPADQKTASASAIFEAMPNAFNADAAKDV